MSAFCKICGADVTAENVGKHEHVLMTGRSFSPATLLGDKTMKTEHLNKLVEMCRSGNCSITLEACKTGIVAKVSASRGDIACEKSVWLDADDADASSRLSDAVKRIKKIA